MTWKKRGLASIDAVLEQVASSLQKRELFEFAAVSGRWADVVGAALAEVSSPLRLARKTLTVEVAEPVWADTMGYMKREIIEKANRLLGRGAISKIKMTIRQGSAPRKPAAEEGPTELPMEVVNEAERAVRHIDDSQLRAAFKRIILKDISLKYSLNKEKTKP